MLGRERAQEEQRDCTYPRGDRVKRAISKRRENKEAVCARAEVSTNRLHFRVKNGQFVLDESRFNEYPLIRLRATALEGETLLIPRFKKSARLACVRRTCLVSFALL